MSDTTLRLSGWGSAIVGITMGVVMGVAASAEGASAGGWISEVSPTGRWVDPQGAGGMTIPAYIELSGLTPNQAVDLVFLDLDTRVSRKHYVRQVITVQAGHAVRLITASAWPNGSGDPSSLNNIQSIGTAFYSTDPRAILLFDQPTGLVTGTRITSQADKTAGKTILDVLNLGAASAFPYIDGQDVYDLVDGRVWSLPNDAQTNGPSDSPLVGTIATDYAFMDTTPSYRMNPGQYNPFWSPAAVPEPSSLMMVGVMGIGLLGRRRGALK